MCLDLLDEAMSVGPSFDMIEAYMHIIGTMFLIRLLRHVDQYNAMGTAAVTSYWESSCLPRPDSQLAQSAPTERTIIVSTFTARVNFRWKTAGPLLSNLVHLHTS